MLMIDAIIRLIPGVLGDETSHKYESFSESGLLEYPQFTRPREFRGMTVPEVLLNGNHAEIQRWQDQQSLQRTQERRGDLVPPVVDDKDKKPKRQRRSKMRRDPGSPES